MSDNSNVGSGGFGLVRLAIFIVALVVSAPFLVVGNYKNGQIKSGINSALSSIGRCQYKEAEKKVEDASQQFGALYSTYVFFLDIVGSDIGGKYYREKDIFFMRGMTKGFGIAERMGEGDANVRELITAAKYDINRTGVSATITKLKPTIQKLLKSLERALPILELCKNGKHYKANKRIQIFMANKENHIDVVLRVVGYILYDIAKNLKTKTTVKMAQKFTNSLSKGKDPFFRGMKTKVALLQVGKKKRSGSSSDLKNTYRAAISSAKKKDYDKAFKLFTKCHSMKPNNDKISYGLALMSYRTGNKDKAKKLCKELIARRPDNKKAIKLLSKL